MKKEVKQLKNKKPNQIGGWLILQLLALIAVIIAQIIDFLMEFFGKTPEEIARSFLYSSQVLDLFILIITIIILVKFLKKESSTPKWMIGWYCLGTFHWFVDVLFFADFFGPDGVWFSGLTDALFVQIILSVIWIWYFIKSERVKNTFVN